MTEAFKTETIEHAGQTVRIEYFYDDTYRPQPWAEYDGNVNIYEKSSRYGRAEKRPSEVILKTNGRNKWVYDIREAHKKARAEGWCTGCDWAKGLTKRQIAARAVAENVEMWRGWLNDDWHYAGVVCTVLDNEGEETDISDSCWGFETLDNYHETAGEEMAISLAESAAKEAEDVNYLASRDVQTVNRLGV